MPDTFSYYVAAYLVAALVYGGYVASLVLRARKIRPPGERREPGAGT